jgi:putative hydrolase of the HAD superfamily
MMSQCETLMLDMDGTVLDLAYDNYVWKELVPARFAEIRGMSVDEARRRLYAKYRAIQGNLEWYCLDHWSDRLGLDVLALHRDVNHRIDFLPGAEEFLQKLRDRKVRVLLVTNSHRDTLDLKDEVTGLTEFFDAIYSSHDFGHAKERQEFWHVLQEEEGFARETTLFVDDNHTVLESAETYGLDMLVEIENPDTSEPKVKRSDYAGVGGVSELLD